MRETDNYAVVNVVHNGTLFALTKITMVFVYLRVLLSSRKYEERVEGCCFRHFIIQATDKME